MVSESVWLIVDDIKSTITRATGRSVATSVFTDRTSATGKTKTKKEVQPPTNFQNSPFTIQGFCLFVLTRCVGEDVHYME